MPRSLGFQHFEGVCSRHTSKAIEEKARECGHGRQGTKIQVLRFQAEAYISTSRVFSIGSWLCRRRRTFHQEGVASPVAPMCTNPTMLVSVVSKCRSLQACEPPKLQPPINETLHSEVCLAQQSAKSSLAAAAEAGCPERGAESGCGSKKFRGLGLLFAAPNWREVPQNIAEIWEAFTFTIWRGLRLGCSRPPPDPLNLESIIWVQNPDRAASCYGPESKRTSSQAILDASCLKMELLGGQPQQGCKNTT